MGSSHGDNGSRQFSYPFHTESRLNVSVARERKGAGNSLHPKRCAGKQASKGEGGRERESEKEREGETENATEKESERASVRVVWVRV